eukprot:Skav200003  [mRNA]  locus=scaffold4475:38161:42612:+ [translate_table: standard]
MQIWDLLFSFINSTRSRISLIWFSSRAGSAQKRAAKGVVWPMPLPFPELHARRANRKQRDASRKLGINFLVLILNSLAFVDVAPSQVMPAMGTPCNFEQWQVVRRLGSHIDQWNNEDVVGPAEMGRAAAKFEGLESVLTRLQSQAQGVHQHFHKYYAKTAMSSLANSKGFTSPEVEVLGELPAQSQHLAKEVEPHRLKFWGTPTFNAAEFLDEANRMSYERPLDFALAPGEEPVKAPKGRVRAAKHNIISFLETLDSGDRLALLPSDDVRLGHLNGVFCLPKDELRDRMVLDARGPNSLEEAEQRWVRSLGSMGQMQHFYLEPHEKLYLYAEDLKEFYHAFQVSPQRINRNALAIHVKPSQVTHLKAYHKGLAKCKSITACLSTMAMGDCNAVAYGQCSHLAVLLRTGCLRLQNFISLTGRPQRARWLAGLMIDDFIVLEALSSPPERADDGCAATLGQEIMRNVRDKYEEVGLPRHPAKAVSGELRGTFWGGQLDGEAGTIRPSLKRVIPLCFIVLRMLQVGACTTELLEVVAGSFVSIFQYRRRLMSSIEEVYAAQRGQPRNAILKIYPELQDEMLQCIGLCALAAIDLRLKPSTKLVTSDASSGGTGAVQTSIGAVATAELQKHALQKGLWNRLLSPAGAYLREKGLLEAECELPEQHYDMHPVFEELVASQKFKLLGHPKRVRGRKHINILEVEAALQAESDVAKLCKDLYYMHLIDSQVALACLVKGRSSSRAINRVLRRSIPEHVSSNVKGHYGYVRSKRNPSDEPSRGLPVRDPLREEAEWLRNMKKGNFEHFDNFLEEHELDLQSLAGLPSEQELLPGVKVDLRTNAEVKIEKRKALRKTRRLRCKASTSPSMLAVAAPGVQRLNEDLVQELLAFPASQFIYDSKFKDLGSALRSGKGALDLFAGARGFSKAFVNLSGTWALSFDTRHGQDQNLLFKPLQTKLIKLLRKGAFAAMGAGPVCASFSTAITPPCRTKLHPEGLPTCSSLQQSKNKAGNDMLAFVLDCVEASNSSGTLWWVENPASSWMWRQRGRLSWEERGLMRNAGDFVCDYCRYGTPWRKRTRFRTSSTTLAGQKLLCLRDHKHVVLRGRCREKKVNYTALAEPYPRKLCYTLGAAMAQDAGLPPGRKKLDVVACAKCVGARVGEAQHPGPRSPSFSRAASLADVELVEPATVQLRERIWVQFSKWFSETFEGAAAEDWLAVSPQLFVSVLVAFGNNSFSQGMPLHYFRQLVAFVQRKFPATKTFISTAWETVSKWELLEPVQHRPPIPEPVVRAMASLAIAWGWYKWAALFLACFYTASRIGELLKVKRCNVLTPEDLLAEQKILYIKFEAPKSRKRGAKVQYTTLDEPGILDFVVRVWQVLPQNSQLYCGTPAAFRSRWDALLKHLAIGKQHKLTPGSLRGGGAVACHRRGVPIADLLWRMRLQRQKTLSYYLQEVAAVSILPSLDAKTRDRISRLQAALPFFLRKNEARSAS